jgi:two-component system sensor histidine kinase UhpB
MTSLRNAVMLRVAAAVVSSFLLIGAGVVWHALAVQRQATESTADLAAALLARQLAVERALSLRGSALLHDAVGSHSTGRPGQCVEFRVDANAVPQRHCHGNEPATAQPPAWFRSLWPDAEPVERRIAVRGATGAYVRVQSDAAQAAAVAWARGGPLLGLCAATLAIAWVLLSLLVRRSLVPLQALGVALDRLAQGDGATALGASGFKELDPLLARFNALSEALSRRTDERDALLRRLVDVQEAERGHIARELHDQLGQNLAAVQALAASIETSAGPDRPSMQREAARSNSSSRR